MTSAQWIDEFKAAEDMKRTEIAEKEVRCRKRKAALEEKAALERMKAVMKSEGCKGAQYCNPSLPNASGEFYRARISIERRHYPLSHTYPTTSGSIRFIDLRMIHHCKPITLIKFLMRFSVP